jgi:uncharacterized protein YjiS (DUF1127 family)
MHSLRKHPLSRVGSHPKWAVMFLLPEVAMSVTTHNALTQRQANAGQLTRRQPRLTTWIGGLFRTWRRRIQERQAFAHLDQRDLRDMGLSQWEVERELAKPFWRE